MSTSANIVWDHGSAYDLFISLWIIHRPDEFGLRPSWAAGVRSRLPLPLRETLEHTQAIIKVPLHWIYTLPDPKNAQSALDALSALAPADRLPALVFNANPDDLSMAACELLLSLDGKQRLTANLAQEIQKTASPSQKSLEGYARRVFDAWSDRGAFGERLTEALHAYVENFFLEEEVRIIPAQEKALSEARQQSETLDLLALLETLSSGVRMDWISEVSQIVLAPSFWSAPFVFFNLLDEDTGIILFGGRPKGVALVPGELVPEDLLNALKALADPTRLRILRYLSEGPTTPSDLAKLLRLRPPTVIHHLQNLRLAGLVQVTVSPKAERRYAIRTAGVGETVRQLDTFIQGD